MKKIFVAIIFCFVILLSSCSKKEEYAEYKFELNEDGESYTFTGLNDNNLKKIVIPSTYNDLPVTAIGEYAISSTVESIYISENIESVYGGIFGRNKNLRKVEVSKDNKKYDSRNNCNAIVETDTNTLVAGCVGTIIPDDIEIIGYGAFYLSEITEIDIPNSVHTIEDYAFFWSKLDYVIIPDSVKSLGEGSFGRCYNLISVKLSNNLESIGYGCFDSTPLTEIFIPKSVKKIDAGIFHLCGSLEKIQVDEDNDVYDSRENCNAIIETKTNKIIAGCRNTVILEEIEIIGDSALTVAYKEETFIIPKNIKVIEPFGISANGNCNPVLEFENKTGWYYINSDGEKVKYDVSSKDVHKQLFYQGLTIYCD